ncbi:MAG: methylamine utilization protein MauJ [Cellvibrionaceae bacterium]
MHKGDWLNCLVEHTIQWPEKNIIVEYNGEEFYLRGLRDADETKLNHPLVSIKNTPLEDLKAHLTKIYNFISILGWYKSGMVDLIHWTIQKEPFLYFGYDEINPNILSGEKSFTCNYLPVITDENMKTSLAFWREGLRLQSLHKPYSFLSFFKVIESQYASSGERVQWFRGAIEKLRNHPAAKARILELEEEGHDINDYIFKEGRCSIAHATLGNSFVTPDNIGGRITVIKDLALMRFFAELFIKEKFKIPIEKEAITSVNQVKPLYKLIENEAVSDLEKGRNVFGSKFQLGQAKVSVTWWSQEPIVGLSNASLQFVSSKDGVAKIRVVNSAKSIKLDYYFDFNLGRIYISDNIGSFDELNSKAIDIFNEYKSIVKRNHIIELNFSDGSIAMCERKQPVFGDFDSLEYRSNKLIEKLNSEHANK